MSEQWAASYICVAMAALLCLCELNAGSVKETVGVRKLFRARKKLSYDQEWDSNCCDVASRRRNLSDKSSGSDNRK